jgi:hypothetical protein
MRARVHELDCSQQFANGMRNTARAGAWVGIADGDALEEKFQSRLRRIVQCAAPPLSPMYWRMCPRAGTEILAFACSVQTLLPLFQPQTVAVRRIAPPIAASDATGTSNALAPVNQVYARFGSCRTSCAVKGK